ncbi:NAD(P)-binding protein [Athelia psychrophila]|uniref:NAD(P)-binding protein n=1 Tax=Athelia psychrophila TaxID=1759441 RepID=A0A166ETJ2_9AGAM|nr:NAD(P)-binding protein [Fibularhizoctonia sp. CBS 109695]
MTQQTYPAGEDAKVWFITGASSGFGLRLTESALARGDFVIATARTLSKLNAALQQSSVRLHRMQLDVTDGEDVLEAKLEEAAQVWGRIDVCVNNAGNGIAGLIEECGSKKLKDQFRTNVFGLLDVTTAVLPQMRKQRSGTIVMFSSRTMWKPEVPGANLYAQSKASVNALGETLAVEVAQFGIKVLIVLPGAFRTNISNGQVYQGNKIPDYDRMRNGIEAMGGRIRGNQPGDPAKAVEIVVDVVRGEGVAQGKEWPLYLPLGPDAETAFRGKSQTITKIVDEWGDVIRSTNFDPI